MSRACPSEARGRVSRGTHEQPESAAPCCQKSRGQSHRNAWVQLPVDYGRRWSGPVQSPTAKTRALPLRMGLS
ncbi:hypothetical protein TOPH_07679 [Tolypocladium ophioglossoides CBS 100239]|uniref:Uncharacterized protein n=1 Tax=Tolypocladium ophioglossoides (strain CBS 100239) TaxID=1163406 RepID=A0A0L0N0Q1_TOLOC|nr:hypothetical protein TOPH_07679 [Tolypocladium ophioglossoides CBS 100239]